VEKYDLSKRRPNYHIRISKQTQDILVTKSSSLPPESIVYNILSKVRITYIVLRGVVLAPLYHNKFVKRKKIYISKAV
jgi:hypothetical protein